MSAEVDGPATDGPPDPADAHSEVTFRSPGGGGSGGGGGGGGGTQRSAKRRRTSVQRRRPRLRLPTLPTGPRLWIPIGLVIGALVLVGLSALRLGTARSGLEAAQRDLAEGRRAALHRDAVGSRAALDRADRHLSTAARAGRSFPLGLLRPVPLVGSPSKALSAATTAGSLAVGAGRDVVEALGSFPTTSAGTLDGHDLGPYHDAAVRSTDPLRRAAEKLQAADRVLAGPSGAVLPQLSHPVIALRRTVRETAATLTHGADGLAAFAQVTDPAADVRLLVLSQDTLELRATGGFIGSFGVLHIVHGQATLERYQSFEELPAPNPPITPPPALGAVLSSFWGLSNVNWWPDFPTTAKTAREMFERQGGGRVDGVVAITELTIKRLIEVFGPIKLPSYDQPVGTEGFEDRLVYEVELKRPFDTPRKKFLSELAHEVVNRAFNLHEGEVPRVADALAASVGTGDLQVWLADDARQALVAPSEISGRLPATDHDFLMLVDTNFSASKANQNLTKDVSYRVSPDRDGSLVASLTVTLRNAGRKTEVNPLYHSYLRIYVPKGSVVVDEGDTNVDEEEADDGAYHVITTELNVDPNTSETVRLHYRLPKAVTDGGTYRLTWPRQAGTSNDTLTAIVGSRRFHADASTRILEVSAGKPRNRLSDLFHGRSPF